MMESTEQNRVWHNGPPLHVGWWNVRVFIRKMEGLAVSAEWGWFDGTGWSIFASDTNSAGHAGRCAGVHGAEYLPKSIEWNDYWPANARVPRLAPEDFEVGAHWVCVDPVWSWDFRGLEFVVTKITDTSMTLESYRSVVVEKLECLPSEHHVPRRCIGPQTRWDFPVAKGGHGG